jgi:hypothetical protein
VDSGGISPHILDLGTRRRWSASFTSHRLYSRYPSNWRLAEEEGESSLDAFEKKILMPLTVIEHTHFFKSARSLVTVATELSSLSFVAYPLV